MFYVTKQVIQQEYFYFIWGLFAENYLLVPSPYKIFKFYSKIITFIINDCLNQKNFHNIVMANSL
jgi:hypothetical protein